MYTEGKIYNVAVVEDEKEAAELLSGFLERYGEENGIMFTIAKYADAEMFLTDFHCQFDIVFMDIEMPCIDGMSAARRLRKLDDIVALVFVTNLARYAINGYEVDAADYILKPLHYDAFALKIRKIITYCCRTDKHSILLTCKGKSKRVRLNDINYVEISAHNIVFHTIQGDMQAYGTLKEIRDELEDKDFALCNRCYLVNLRNVRNIDGFSVFVGDDELQISRPQKKEFSERFRKFIKSQQGE